MAHHHHRNAPNFADLDDEHRRDDRRAPARAAPTNNSGLLMAQLAANTRRLELAWLNALNRILYHRLGAGEIVVWS